ncbi:NinG recombination protein [Pseudoalteromonas phage B8b]|uniref:NinG recombination protein n=1 Tax=Pseudoalteromonas phage B8b TaxID=1506997 RepID=A0A076G6F3_9CAUD|nr:NinG recombination protein [Pseudoalteromonas phage B8b]|tara:strand:+ start:240 stop:476 length:237 start_codon:yes stop_codon:yes gene_type:complete
MANVIIETQAGDLELDASRTHISDHQFMRLITNMNDGDVLIEQFLADYDEELLTLIVESNPKLEKKLKRIIEVINSDS